MAPSSPSADDCGKTENSTSAGPIATSAQTIAFTVRRYRKFRLRTPQKNNVSQAAISPSASPRIGQLMVISVAASTRKPHHL